MVSSDCRHESCLSDSCYFVNVGSAFLYKKLSHLEVAVETGSVKRSHFCLFRDGSFQQLRMFIEQSSDFIVLLSFDVVEHVLS